MKGDSETISRLMERNTFLEMHFVKLKQLLHEVQTKVPGERRFDTALRYIREAENRCLEAGQDKTKPRKP